MLVPLFGLFGPPCEFYYYNPKTSLVLFLFNTQPQTPQFRHAEMDAPGSDSQSRFKRLLRAMIAINSESQLLKLLMNVKDVDHMFACRLSCKAHGVSCINFKTTFLSTRNSKRSTHAYLFLFALLGGPEYISDAMVASIRRLMRPNCGYGIAESNGHAKSTEQICINPFHYNIVSADRVVKILISEGLLPSDVRAHVAFAPTLQLCAGLRHEIRTGSIPGPKFNLGYDAPPILATSQSQLSPPIPCDEEGGTSDSDTPTSSATASTIVLDDADVNAAKSLMLLQPPTASPHPPPPPPPAAAARACPPRPPCIIYYTPCLYTPIPL